MNKQKVKKLTITAMMGAVAFVLMFLRLNIPVLSPVADLDLSALPELIGGFILGPLEACAIVVIKLALKLLFQGTATGFTGELSNLLVSLAYVLPAVLYYRGHRTKKGAAVGIVIGCVVSVAVAVFSNIYIIFPFYMGFFGLDWDGVVAMFSKAAPWITGVPSVVAFSIIPFNVVSRGITGILTMLVYKKISVPLKKFIQE